MKEINLVTVLSYTDEYVMININDQRIKARFNNDFIKPKVGTSFLAILEHRSNNIIITPVDNETYQNITVNIIS